jgi:putative ubiquitin-RnfH superfamily antitoxin RatB of RatAB toxin-antitoxin module
MACAEHLRATVVYLAPPRHLVLSVAVPAGTCLRDAVAVSGLLEHAPELAAQPLDLGVFNRVRNGDDLVRDGDRIEVYRPLAVDPKEARRVRAEVRRRRKAAAAEQG